MLYIMIQFLSNRSQHVIVDGCRSKLVNVVFVVLLDAVFGPLLFLHYTLVIVLSPGVGVTVAESLNRDLGTVSEWCYLWGMKLNASKIKTMIVSWSLTMYNQSPSLPIGRTVLHGGV